MSWGPTDYMEQGRVSEQRRTEAREAESSLLSSQVNLGQTASDQAKWDLQLSKEQWDFQKKQAEAAGAFATKFMSEWSSAMKGLKDVYGKTFDSIFGGGEGGAIGGQVGKLNELGDLMTQEYKDYRDTWGATEQEFMEQAKVEGAARGQAISELQQHARPDYAGVEGRAAADVAGQSEIARQSAAREMMGYGGVDPTAGKFGALTRRSYLDEARDTAISMNVARRGEKERAAGVSLNIAKTADPRVSGNLALGISRGGNELARTAADVYGAGAQAISSQTSALANLTSSYGSQVVSPYAEMAGTMMGMGGIPGAGVTPSNSVSLSRSAPSNTTAIPAAG